MFSQYARLRNDLYCVEWGVKLYSLTHLVNTEDAFMTSYLSTAFLFEEISVFCHGLIVMVGIIVSWQLGEQHSASIPILNMSDA